MRNNNKQEREIKGEKKNLGCQEGKTKTKAKINSEKFMR